MLNRELLLFTFCTTVRNAQHTHTQWRAVSAAGDENKCRRRDVTVSHCSAAAGEEIQTSSGSQSAHTAVITVKCWTKYWLQTSNLFICSHQIQFNFCVLLILASVQAGLGCLQLFLPESWIISSGSCCQTSQHAKQRGADLNPHEGTADPSSYPFVEQQQNSD